MTACVFRLCTAEITMVPEREAPGADPRALVRVPQHRLGGHEEFGLCPASLLAYPISDYDATELETMAVAIERMISDRVRSKAEARDVEQGGNPSNGDRPGTDRWFRNSDGDPNGGGQNSGPHAEQQLLPPKSPNRLPPGILRPGPLQPPPGGFAVTSVEGVKRIITRAGEVLAEASAELFITEGRASEAAELLNLVRDTSSDPMGAPEVMAAIEKIGEANELLRQAIEIGVTYKEGL